MRHRNESPARVAAEVRDPAVVGALIGERQLGIGDLALPEEPERRIQNAALEVLAVQQLDPLARVRAAVRDVICIAPLRPALGRRIAHRPEQPENALAGAVRGAAVDGAVVGKRRTS